MENYACAGAFMLFILVLFWKALYPPKRRKGGSYLMSHLRDKEERMRAAAERQAAQPQSQPFVSEPSSVHYRWLQEEYAKKAFEQARSEMPLDYARLANLAGTVADLKEGRGGHVPERVHREKSETTLFVQVERRPQEGERGIEVTNHPLFSRRK